MNSVQDQVKEQILYQTWLRVREQVGDEFRVEYYNEVSMKKWNVFRGITSQINVQIWNEILKNAKS